MLALPKEIRELSLPEPQYLRGLEETSFGGTVQGIA